MKIKKNIKSLLQRNLTEKYLKNSFTNETTKIDIDLVEETGYESSLYFQLKKFSTNELMYKLCHSNPNSNEKKIIKRIINERE